MHDLYDIERVVPHRGTLRLVDRLVAWDEDSVAVELRVPHEGPFSHAEGVPAWVGVEYMAQAIAAWAGCRARSAGHEPSIPDHRVLDNLVHIWTTSIYGETA